MPGPRNNLLDLTNPRNLLKLTEAIDYAGPVLYSADWIGELTDKEKAVLGQYGPKPYGKAVQFVDPCPSHSAVRLDRALGRDVRMGVQRATVLDWLLSVDIMDRRYNCDPATLDRALNKTALSARGRGRPADIRGQVLLKMLSDIRVGALTADQLEKMKQKSLVDRYGPSRRVCAVARKIALPEARRLALVN